MKQGGLTAADKVSLVRAYCYIIKLKQQPLAYFRCSCPVAIASIAGCAREQVLHRLTCSSSCTGHQVTNDDDDHDDLIMVSGDLASPLASFWRPIVGCNRAPSASATVAKLAWQGFNQTFAVVIAWPLFAELLARATENTSALAHCPSGLSALATVLTGARAFVSGRWLAVMFG